MSIPGTIGANMSWATSIKVLKASRTMHSMKEVPSSSQVMIEVMVSTGLIQSMSAAEAGWGRVRKTKLKVKKERRMRRTFLAGSME